MSRVQIIYLHGFASSPRSSKAAWFTARARQAGVPLACPDLNGDDFGRLTVTRMLDQVDGMIDAMPDGPAGARRIELGAFVGLFAAGAGPAASVPRDIPSSGWCSLPRARTSRPGLAPFRSGAMGTGGGGTAGRISLRQQPHTIAGVRLLRRCGAIRRVCGQRRTTPTLVYQGTRDETVDASTVARWASTRPHVILHLLDDDHQLLASLDQMWTGVSQFLGLPA